MNPRRGSAAGAEPESATAAPAHDDKRSKIECRDLAKAAASREDGLGPPKRPRCRDDLFFEPQPMVRWLRPKVLVGAAREVAISDLFARFADKRELQGGLPARWWDASGLLDDGRVWLDFASDTGDGFGPTYAVASQLASETLKVKDEQLPRGRVLVLGGDQVYPSADWDAYRDRFVGPYTAALPYAPAPNQPHMFVLPGNHDWYDGLTSFMRLFCQGGWIGGWKTEQTRSYFAIKLPEPWWLWAIDTQFDTYVDAPQLRYFRAMAEELDKGHKVILVTAKPSWVHVRSDRETPQAWQTLAMLEHLISEEEATLELTLTGDLHHYARYQGTGEQSASHKVTAGGAGAYTSATHPLPGCLHLPDHLDLSKAPGGGCGKWNMQRTHPSIAESKRIRDRPVAWSLLRHTPSFGLVTAVVYAVTAAAALLGSPGFGLALVAVLAVLLFRGLQAFGAKGAEDCKSEPWRVRRGLVVLVHTAMHVAPAVLVTLLLESETALSGAALGVSALVAGGLVGFLLGPVTFASYLGVANRIDPGWHANEIFAAQSHTAGRGNKHFLRLRVDADGGVRVYALGVDGTSGASDTDLGLADPEHPPGAPWLEPAEGLGVTLIESFDVGAGPASPAAGRDGDASGGRPSGRDPVRGRRRDP